MGRSPHPRSADDVHYHRIAVDPPFDLLRATYRRQRFVPHAHAEFGIGVVERGSAMLRHAKGADLHSAGMFIIIPPGLVHAGQAQEPFRYRMMYLPVWYLETASSLAGHGARSPGFAGTAVVDAPLAARFARVHAQLERGSAPERRLPELLDVLASLIREHAVPGRAVSAREPGARLRAVRSFIDAEYLRPLTISELAAVGRMSASYLIRSFHRTFGLPPYVYVEQLRIQHARCLIERGVPLSAAALMSRFSDQSHLTRRFKRTYGITPGAFAARIAASARRRSCGATVGHQLAGGRYGDAVAPGGAHDGAADRVQLERPPGRAVLLHRAAHAGGQGANAGQHGRRIHRGS